MAYDIGYDTAAARPPRPGRETWAQIAAPARRLVRDLFADLDRSAPPASRPRPLMVEDVMLRPTLIQSRADLASSTSHPEPRLDTSAPLGLFNGALLIWRRPDFSEGRNFTLSVGLVFGGRSADAAIMLLAFSFSR